MQHLAALLFHQTAVNFDAMIELTPMSEVEHAPRRAGLRIVGTEDEAAHTGMQHCADAHHTGLERDIHRRPFEPVVIFVLCCHAHRDDLRVRGGVRLDDAAIDAGPYDFVVPDEHRADRYFADFSRNLRLGQRPPHAFLVSAAPAAHSHSIVAGGLPEIS
jgi:hypothetical protein